MRKRKKFCRADGEKGNGLPMRKIKRSAEQMTMVAGRPVRS